MIRFLLEVLVVVGLLWVLIGSLDGEKMTTYVERHGVGPTLERVWNGPKK
jgi:hypothetical protein